MNGREQAARRMQDILLEMRGLIDKLSLTEHPGEKTMLLGHLRGCAAELSMLAQELGDKSAPGEVRVFTPAELARYNGRNGAPAYVAVNGTVYDMTYEPTWGAATHFGLAAGKDLSGAFASCHAGQQFLGRLKAVGKMTR